jgi:hypothetical protein
LNQAIEIDDLDCRFMIENPARVFSHRSTNLHLPEGVRPDVHSLYRSPLRPVRREAQLVIEILQSQYSIPLCAITPFS